MYKQVIIFYPLGQAFEVIVCCGVGIIATDLFHLAS